MKIDKQTFDLEEELSISIDFEDNDGLIFIPKNVNVEIKIANYFGKIVINNLSIKHLEDELSLSKVGLEQNLSNLDLKLLDRFLFKQLSDKATFNYSPFDSFLEYDFSVYENKIAALCCSSSAIIPMWAFMLASSYLNPVCSQLYFGNREDVFQNLLLKNINAIDSELFKEKKVIIKVNTSTISVLKKVIPIVLFNLYEANLNKTMGVKNIQLKILLVYFQSKYQ